MVSRVFVEDVSSRVSTESWFLKARIVNSVRAFGGRNRPHPPCGFTVILPDDNRAGYEIERVSRLYRLQANPCSLFLFGDIKCHQPH